MTAPTLAEALAAVEAERQAQEKREWAGCLTSVVAGVSRAARVGAGQTVIVFRFGALWEIRRGGVGCGFVEYPSHLEDVMRHCADSGWTVTRERASWWNRLTGRPLGWRVEVGQ